MSLSTEAELNQVNFKLYEHLKRKENMKGVLFCSIMQNYVYILIDYLFDKIISCCHNYYPKKMSYVKRNIL